MKIQFSLIAILMLISVTTQAQVAINTNGSTANASAALDISSTTTGLLIPRMTTAERVAITTPATGLMVYDNTTNGFWYYNGTAWTEISAATSTGDKITDANNDTKIQVEESTDEDIIRFDLAGTERWTMTGAQLEPTNSGQSVFIGENAGANDDLTTNRNVFVGYNTGQTNTIGVFNTATGHTALNKNESGDYNTAIGASALEKNTTGSLNTGIGVNALKGNTTGGENAALGSNALNNNSTGDKNTAIGRNASLLNSSGSGNVAVGNFSLISNQTGNNNTAIGNNSGTTANSLNNTTAIGYKAKVASSNSLVLGGTGANAVNVGIGTTSPTELLTLSGTSGTDGILFPDNTLQTTAFTGSTAGDEITDADNDTKIQVEESADEDIIRFDIAGTEFFRMNNGRLEVLNTGSSVLIGENAGVNDNLTNNANIFIGTNSGASVTNQVQNTAIGSSSLRFLNSGFGNIAYGHEAGQFVQTGSNNTFIGRFSGKGAANHTKNNNTFLGAQSGELSEAGNNTYVGFQSGQNNTSGTGNLFLGLKSGQNESGSNKLYIDNSNTSTPLIYGEFDTDLLRVNGTLNINNAFSFPKVDGTVNQVLQTDGFGNLTWQTNTGVFQTLITDTDNNTKIQVEETANEDIIRFDIAGTEAMVINSNGNVGIGTDAPNQPIEVIGLMRSTNTLGLGGASTDIGMSGSNAIINFQPFGTGNLELQINGASKLTIVETGKVGIGVTPNSTSSLFTVNGGTQTSFLRITNGATNGYILKSDALGNATWQTNSGVVQNLIADTDNNTKIQVEETANEDIIRFDLAGAEAFRISKNAGGETMVELPNSSNSTHFGLGAGQSSTTGLNNTFIGSFAGHNNTTAGANTFIGRKAGYNTSIGFSNVAIGGFTLLDNETGGYNVAIGTSALGAGGINDVNNVAIGFEAGYNADGSNNIFIGRRAGKNLSGSNRLYIDNSSISASLIYGEFDNNLIRINGDFETTNNVSLGTSVSSTVKIGNNGTNLNAIIKATVSKDVPNVSSNNSEWVTFTVTGAAIGGAVYISPSSPLDNKIVIAQAYVSAANTVTVNFRNVGSSSSNPANMNYYISIIQ